MHGGFEYVAREARRELLEEARNRRLVRLARPDLGFRERLARLARLARPLSGLREMVRPRAADGGEVAVGGPPDSVHLEAGPAEGPEVAVEVYLGGGGRVVRRTDLGTGEITDSFVGEGWIRR
jgi:hypothetical protein